MSQCCLGLCVLNVIKEFGQISGLSISESDLSLLELLPTAEMSSDDLRGGSHKKATWIQNMVYCHNLTSAIIVLDKHNALTV